ncbi:hypothetical protein D3C85_811670 [compost metagenome]
MSTNSENRDIEVLFNEVMPGYRCFVSRQTEGAINLQFESLSSHKTITLPAVDSSLWDSPEKLQMMCEQIAEEFLFVSESKPSTPDEASAPIQVTRQIAAKLTEVLLLLQRRS